jgi:CRISPR-associated endonuclease Cas1
MSKKPYDFLASDKEPILYIEKARIRLKDGFLVSQSVDDEPFVITPGGTLILALGHGTSISHDAAIYSSLNDMQIAFIKGGCNVHSYFMSGRYQDPQSLVTQALLTMDSKLEVAKAIMRFRILRSGWPAKLVDDCFGCDSTQDLIAFEGRWSKDIYRKFAMKNEGSFKRDFDGVDLVNMKLNILNNSLYSICSAICLSCGVHPSMGFIHGLTRRGGLAFDLADIYKEVTTLPIAFNSKISSGQKAMYELSNLLRKNNSKIIKEIIRICLAIGNGPLSHVESEIDDMCSKLVKS